jgi:hypothetical protein
MKWLMVGLIFGAANCVAGNGVAATRDPGGVYSSLQYNEESGDLLGMAIEIHATLPAYVSVLVDEGNCQDRERWPLTIVGDRLSFAVTYEAVDQSGHRMTLPPIRFVGFLNGSTITLTSPDAPEIREQLSRVDDPKAVLPTCAIH